MKYIIYLLIIVLPVKAKNSGCTVYMHEVDRMTRCRVMATHKRNSDRLRALHD